jgi:hypothetical protein
VDREALFQLKPCCVSLCEQGVAVSVEPARLLVLPNPTLLSVLVALRRPRTLTDVAISLPDLPLDVIELLVRELCVLGACASVERVSDDAPFELLPRLDPEDLLPAINELSRLNPLIHSAEPLSAEFVRARDLAYHSIHCAMGALHDAVLSMQRAGSIARQAVRRRIAAEFATPYNVIIGGGATDLPGWVNVDVQSSIAPLDLRHPLPIDDGMVARVYAAFVLEHLFYPDEANALLRDTYRVLAKGGTARILIPNAEYFMRGCINGNSEDIAFLEDKWIGPYQFYTPLAAALFYLGAAGGLLPGPNSHKFAYDFELLKKLCHASGFSFVRRSSYMNALDIELNLDNRSASLTAFDPLGDQVLFVDVQK